MTPAWTVIGGILLGLAVAPLAAAIAWCHLVPGNPVRRNRTYHWLYAGIALAVFLYAWTCWGWVQAWPLAVAAPFMIGAALTGFRLCSACGIISGRVVRHCPHCGAAIGAPGGGCTPP
ncbi:hypothetical protein AZA_90195 [Nitrospirillum viridazoti Y2]|uniref:Uncharacterized protein n=1 Tax=Nitrospirillum amazonense TaxID=28077 RepID=A0A560HXP2_9PROT|nr:hypothetical protein [Nitrospirillum amazonense]EGX99583.1 hypothetical protein AZA_90195 [Nitrospirillum amazonense Y2]TWB51427.1 hypothetical protein FBZ92_12020 [Nitrospirillum amazonense]